MGVFIITLVFHLFWWAVFYWQFRKDRSRYRNCYLLFIAMCSSVPFIVWVSGDHAVTVLMIMFYAVMFGMLITPFLLIFNGIVMIRREGRQIPHLLSLALGMVILLGEAAVVYTVIMYSTYSNFTLMTSITYVIGSVLGSAIFYGSMSVLIFVIYVLMMQIVPFRANFDYVIILGAGLIDGEKCSKLLTDRIDKAIEVYRKSKLRPKLIPSGGQGDDEKISEAEAMKRYLLEKGIPEEDIILEDKSTTTYENLTNSKAIIESHGGGNKIALVSNNYHVYRALRHCRKIGLKCTGIGGHTALYFWPSALIREYIAIHAEKKHAVIFVLGLLACLTVDVYAMVNGGLYF